MVDAQHLTGILGGRWSWHYGTAPCPVCQPERRRDQTALTLKDGSSGRLLAHCKKSNCAFADILAAAGLGAFGYRPRDALDIARNTERQRAQTDRTARQAARCWDKAQPIAGTVAETYLRRRGITCDLPPTLRFHPAAWHGPTASQHPALIARVQGGDSIAVHRTFLCADGLGKAAFAPNKMMLGAVTGGAVRLSDGPGALVVAEGIETALSLACGVLRAPATLWAALSTSGVRGLRLPPVPGALTIAPDGDPAGRAAAHALAARAHASGWTVSLLPAPDGHDWNDVLTMKEARP